MLIKSRRMFVINIRTNCAEIISWRHYVCFNEPWFTNLGCGRWMSEKSQNFYLTRHVKFNVQVEWQSFGTGQNLPHTRFFISISNAFFSAQAQMLLSEIQNSLKLALPYLTKKCLKYYLGREQSFDKGFRVQFSIFSEIGFENWQIST